VHRLEVLIRHYLIHLLRDPVSWKKNWMVLQHQVTKNSSIKFAMITPAFFPLEISGGNFSVGTLVGAVTALELEEFVVVVGDVEVVVELEALVEVDEVEAGTDSLIVVPLAPAAAHM